jgi:hypothetical protein
LQDVELVDGDVEDVTGRSGDQSVSLPNRPQRSAQLGEADLQVRRRPVRLEARPELAGQPVGGDYAVGVQQQHRQYGASPWAAHRERLTVVNYLNRAKDSELHRAPLVRTSCSPAGQLPARRCNVRPSVSECR